MVALTLRVQGSTLLKENIPNVEIKTQNYFKGHLSWCFLYSHS